MTEELIKLHEKHSALCATAHKANVEMPSDLTVDFDDVEVGRTVCASLEALLRDRGVADGANIGQGGPDAGAGGEGKKPSRPKRQKKPPAVATAHNEESDMSTTAKKTKTKKSTAKKAKANARKPVKGATKKAASKPRGEGKTAEVGKLLKRASGVTRAQILELTGWKAVSVQQLATSLGVKLKIDETKRPFVYRAA